MASCKGCGNNFGDPQNQNQLSISKPLAGEGSSYGPTLDEVQSFLEDPGKTLSDVNFDELLNSLWSPEVNAEGAEVVDYEQTMQQRGQHVLNSSLNTQDVQWGQPVLKSSQNPQSSNALSGNMNKTVDKVWQHGQQGPDMTLEDFLVKAGVVAESSRGKIHSSSVAGEVDLMVLPRQTQWMQYQIPIPEIHPQQQQSVLPVFVPNQPFRQPMPTSGNPIIDATYTQLDRTKSPSELRDSSSDTPAPVRRRTISVEAIQKSIERREKKMIKNRESAARSRERKQAHTYQLESKVSCLQQEIGKRKQKKETEKLFPREPLPEPRFQLRRTSSGPI